MFDFLKKRWIEFKDKFNDLISIVKHCNHRLANMYERLSELA